MTCYAHFRPQSTPLRDVTRVGILCGPGNGMRVVGPAEEGRVGPGPEGKTHAFPLGAGECVRVFAVADASLEDVEVTLLDPTGAVLATERGHDRWPVMQADRPVCVLHDGIYTVRVRARKGSGAYAIQAWRLP